MVRRCAAATDQLQNFGNCGAPASLGRVTRDADLWRFRCQAAGSTSTTPAKLAGGGLSKGSVQHCTRGQTMLPSRRRAVGRIAPHQGAIGWIISPGGRRGCVQFSASGTSRQTGSLLFSRRSTRKNDISFRQVHGHGLLAALSSGPTLSSRFLICGGNGVAVNQRNWGTWQ